MEQAVRHSSRPRIAFSVRVATAVRGHGFELSVAVVFMLVGITLLINPMATLISSPVGHDVGYWAVAWALIYVAAGPAIVYGVVWERPNHRLAGLVLLATALVMNGTAAIANGVEPRDFTYFIYAAACLLRAYLVVRDNAPRG